jgi:SAM-dependent methyltransferase
MRTTKSIEKSFKFTSILDAGSGNGDYAFWMAQRYPNTAIDACDLSEDSIEQCKKIQKLLGIKNIRYYQQDLKEFLNEGKYDYIYSNHVLEHIPDNSIVIENLVKSLKPGGYIYIQLPNKVQMRYKWGKKFVEPHEEWAKDEHIGLRLTLDILAEELSSLGCEIIKKKHTEGFLGELSFELAEMARNYYNSNALYGILFPFLKLLGYIDSLMHYNNGNGILVLARKKHNKSV